MNQQFRMVKQMIDMQRASSDGMINSMIMMWDQTGSFLEGAAWLPEEGRKALKQWIDMNKKACENLKNAIDSGYSSMEGFCGATAQKEERHAA
ncbi:conserved hypothetical protein [Syntrophobacter sp. SbD1]|nr:conserved hypothetical protein [Syntrophobacter sp. SbD1]